MEIRSLGFRTDLAIRVYRSVGFRDTEVQTQLEQRAR